jgi:hypothetical protein
MKTLYTLLVLSLLVLTVVPSVFAVSVGTGLSPDITTEKFAPKVWMCDHRLVTDDNTEPGRISTGGQELVERINNYAFEGEKISWKILVMDKNGVEKVKDVYATVGQSQGAGNDIEANCQLDHIVTNASDIDASCNARIDQATLQQVFSTGTAAYYTCTLTVETQASMGGPYWVTVEAEDLDGLTGTMDENEYWFFNPIIALTVEGTMTFDNVRPGTDSYSKTVTVGNNADAGSGVMMDMFITGTDFYDSASSGAKCPTTNQLSLSNFRYFATNGAYSTYGTAGADNEGYRPIAYGIGFNNPDPFYDKAEILPAQKVGPYYTANLLAPGAEMALTFKLSMPEPCNGDFDTGNIFFWAEAI